MILISTGCDSLSAHGIGQLLQCGSHFRLTYRLQNIVMNSIAQCLLCILEVVEAADNDEYQIQSSGLFHTPDQTEPVQNGHPDIGNHQIRLQQPDHIQGLRSIVRLSNYGEFKPLPLY
ncbi:hypothetical protein D3C85_1628860 [compost metagenome]